MTDCQFQRHEKIKKSYEYRRISKMGCRYHTSHFIIYAARNSLGHPRLGLTVGRKVGNAVTRNKIKRKLREFYRHNKNIFFQYDYNILVKKKLNHFFHDELTAAIFSLKNHA